MIFIWNTMKRPIFRRFRRPVAQRLQEVQQMYLSLIHVYIDKLMSLTPIVPTTRHVMATAVGI